MVVTNAIIGVKRIISIISRDCNKPTVIQHKTKIHKRISSMFKKSF